MKKMFLLITALMFIPLVSADFFNRVDTDFVNATQNVTIGTGNITVTINGSSGLINTSGNITADTYFGDGSQLTGISGSGLWTDADANYIEYVSKGINASNSTVVYPNLMNWLELTCTGGYCIVVNDNAYVKGDLLVDGGTTFGSTTGFVTIEQLSAFTNRNFWVGQNLNVSWNATIEGNATASSFCIPGETDECLSDKQKIVSGTCAAGSSIRRIYESGSVTCETDDVGSSLWENISHTATYSGDVSIGDDLSVSTGNSYFSDAYIEGILYGDTGIISMGATFDMNGNSVIDIDELCFGGSDCISAWSEVEDVLTEEQVEDYIGGMVTGNTETNITVTYQDSDGTLDFVVSGGGTGDGEQENTKNFVKNSCFYYGDSDVANGIPSWNHDFDYYGDIIPATIGTNFFLNITETPDISVWHQTSNPYLWLKVNSTDFSSITADDDIVGRQIRLTGNQNPDNTNLTYDIADHNSTHIKMVMPYGMTIPTYVAAPAWGENITQGEIIEIVDVASRCGNAYGIQPNGALISEWLTVPNTGRMLLDVEANVPNWHNGTRNYARVIVQIDVADTDENLIYRYTTGVGGTTYPAQLSNSNSYPTNMGHIGTEGWQRMQFLMEDMSDQLNWIAASNGLGSYDPARKTPAIKVRLRILNQYNNATFYFTGVQLIQGENEKAFDAYTITEGDYIGTPFGFASLDDDSTATAAELNFGEGSAETSLDESVVWNSIGHNFSINEDGVYELNGDLLIQCSATATLTMAYLKNEATEVTLDPVCHSSVDPVSRTLTWVAEYDEGDEIELVVDSWTAATMTIKTGSSFTVKRIY